MMIKNLPAEEVHTVMGYMRHAVKDTYFEKWLASGGFQWPTNPSMPSTKVGTTYSLLGLSVLAVVVVVVVAMVFEIYAAMHTWCTIVCRLCCCWKRLKPLVSGRLYCIACTDDAVLQVRAKGMPSLTSRLSVSSPSSLSCSSVENAPFGDVVVVFFFLSVVPCSACQLSGQHPFGVHL